MKKKDYNKNVKVGLYLKEKDKIKKKSYQKDVRMSKSSGKLLLLR